MRIHATRHQFADMVVSSGRSLYDVQVLLRHSDPRVSQRYARLSMNTLKEAASNASLFATKFEANLPTQQNKVVPFLKTA